jgi:hypothetical protein
MVWDHTIEPSLPSTLDRIRSTADALTMARRFASTIAHILPRLDGWCQMSIASAVL